jgi:tRNA 2-thiouridine synthesizing protein C
MARIGVVFRHGAYARSEARDAFDALLAALAFEHEVRALFCGEGVCLLRRDQQPGAIGERRWTDGLKALAGYGIAGIGVEQEALARFGLTASDLLLPCTSLGNAELAEWLRNFDVVLGA